MILYPNLAILVNFEIPKLLVKISGTFLVKRYEKVPMKLKNKISRKTNVSTHTAQLKEILKKVSRR